MGTNYHYFPPMSSPDFEGRHIGKSSAGWCFALHVYPDEGIHTLEDWKKLFLVDGSWIMAYGKVTPAEMLEAITNRARPALSPDRQRQGRKLKAEWQETNHATDGPNNLHRHMIEEGYCIGHGEGTWDYLVGDFS